MLWHRSVFIVLSKETDLSITWYDSPHYDLVCRMHLPDEHVWIFCSPEMHIVFVHYSIHIEMCLIEKPDILQYGSFMLSTWSKVQSLLFIICSKFVCIFCMRTFANLTIQFAGWNVCHNLPCWVSQNLIPCKSNCICILGHAPVYGVWMLSLQNWAALLKESSLWIVFFLERAKLCTKMSTKTTVL